MKTPTLVILTIILFGVSVFLRKLTVDRMHPYQLQILAAIVYSLCIPLWVILTHKENIAWSYDFNAWALAFACLITNIAGAIFFGNLLKSSNNTGGLTVLISINPIITFMLSMIFLGESLTSKKIAACIFAFIGLILFNL